MVQIVGYVCAVGVERLCEVVDVECGIEEYLVLHEHLLQMLRKVVAGPALSIAFSVNGGVSVTSAFAFSLFDASRISSMSS